ncbi:MAG: hypothetical protein ABI743_03020 [bacterium]
MNSLRFPSRFLIAVCLAVGALVAGPAGAENEPENFGRVPLPADWTPRCVSIAAEWQTLPALDGISYREHSCLSPDGRTLYVLRSTKTETIDPDGFPVYAPRPLRVDLATGTITEGPLMAGSIDDLLWADDGVWGALTNRNPPLVPGYTTPLVLVRFDPITLAIAETRLMPSPWQQLATLHPVPVGIPGFVDPTAETLGMQRCRLTLLADGSLRAIATPTLHDAVNQWRMYEPALFGLSADSRELVGPVIVDWGSPPGGWSTLWSGDRAAQFQEPGRPMWEDHSAGPLTARAVDLYTGQSCPVPAELPVLDGRTARPRFTTPRESYRNPWPMQAEADYVWRNNTEMFPASLQLILEDSLPAPFVYPGQPGMALTPRDRAEDARWANWVSAEPDATKWFRWAANADYVDGVAARFGTADGADDYLLDDPDLLLTLNSGATTSESRIAFGPRTEVLPVNRPPLG